jgi:hypothetical protein
MRLSKERIRHMAEALVSRLHLEGCIELAGDKRTAVESLEHAITEELSVEDRLNAEVRQLMKAYETEIERGEIDYQKMFTMIKNKLVRDRGIIL